MKKVIAVLSSILLSGVVFTGCKKGEGDPALSLHTRKGRLTGDWVLSEGKTTDTDNSPSTTTSTWSGTSVQMTYVAGTVSQTGTGTGSYKMSIVKDGTWTMDVNTTVTYSGPPSYVIITSEKSEGTWNWTGKVGELKNKSQMVMAVLNRTTTTTDPTGTTTDIEAYTGGDAPTSINDIYQLKNKELIIKWDGTSLNTGASTGSSSSSGEMTFTKE